MIASKEQQEAYKKIMHVYDLLEEMVAVIQRPQAKNSGDQLQVAEQFILKTTESIEAILNTYIANIKRGSKPTIEDCRAIEDAARKIFIEIARFVSLAKHLKKAA